MAAAIGETQGARTFSMTPGTFNSRDRVVDNKVPKCLEPFDGEVEHYGIWWS